MQMKDLGYLLFYLMNSITLTYIADSYMETTFYYRANANANANGTLF